MQEAASADAPTAQLWPSAGADGEQPQESVQITVYIVSGHHGVVTVPERFCRECHRFVRAADAGADLVDVQVDVQVVSWWTRFPWALRHGGYHPPVMVVGDELLCQGYDVPSPETVAEAIEAASTS